MREFLCIGILAILGWGGIVACDHEIGERAYIVSGIISDSLGGTPVDSAIVSWDDTINAPQVHSDATGFYAIQIPAGSHELFVRKIGYQTNRRDLGSLNANRPNVNVLLQTP